MTAWTLWLLGAVLFWQGFDGGTITLNDRWQLGVGVTFLVTATVCESFGKDRSQP